VRLPQIENPKALEGNAQNAALPAVTPFSKILVVLAGPLMNIVFAFAIASLLYVVGLPVAVDPPIIGYVNPFSPEGKIGIAVGDWILSVDGKDVESLDGAQMAAVMACTNPIAVVIRHGTEIAHYQLTATVNKDLNLKYLNLYPQGHPTIHAVTRGGPGDKSGLQAGDEFVSLGGVPVCSREEVVAIIRKNPGRKVPATIIRAGKQISLLITPSAGAPGRIDALLSDQETKKYEIQHPTPLKQVATVIARTWDTLKAICHPSVSGVSVKDLSGPPGILTRLAANVNADIRLALSFLVLLNINLALINLLPLPVLDGGHITIAAIELISRRSLPQRMLTSLTTTFALLLLCFVIYVSYNDFRRWSIFSSMFQNKPVLVDEGEKSNESFARTAPRTLK